MPLVKCITVWKLKGRTGLHSAGGRRSHGTPQNIPFLENHLFDFTYTFKKMCYFGMMQRPTKRHGKQMCQKHIATHAVCTGAFPQFREHSQPYMYSQEVCRGTCCVYGKEYTIKGGSHSLNKKIVAHALPVTQLEVLQAGHILLSLGGPL